MNQSSNKAFATYAFLFECHNTVRLFFVTFLRALGFSAWYTSINFNLKSPAAFPPNNNVRQSFEIFYPGHDFSLAAIKVHNGNFFQNNPVSSTLNICSSL